LRTIEYHLSTSCDGIEGLTVADLMKEAGLTHGGFCRHFDSQEQLVAEAAQRALTQGSEWTVAAGTSADGDPAGRPV
jgi:AcrR family transcriptional regulator